MGTTMTKLYITYPKAHLKMLITLNWSTECELDAKEKLSLGLS